MGEQRGGPWRAWYKTARWLRLRSQVFLRDLYTCRLCRQVTASAICDHIKPHRGDDRLFFDEANLQTLCKQCHDSIKQADEQQSLHQRGVWY
jgi:5-methylcytosine-specific restriction protein A